MRAPLSLLVCSIALAPGCLGGGGSLEGPTTLGDGGRTVWQISDGLCGGGLFGSDCDLSVHVATDAAPLVMVRGHGGTSLDHATLMGGTGVTITHFTTTSDDQGTLLEANVQSTSPGIADVIVLDASGHEVDRAHITFVTATAIVCGDVTHATHQFSFPGLTNGPIAIVEMPADGGASVTTTTLGCRVSDASGSPLLSVDAIGWTLAPGATGTVSITSDDAFGSTPAQGATARLVTSGTGSATVVASLGTISQSIPVSFR